MSDGKLQYEIEIAGTDVAAAGLGKVETGLDKVAAAEKRTRESAYGARQAHENWVAGYKGEVFSEMAEKIKRVSHVSRETNPELKWMGEGFKAAKSGSDGLGISMTSLRQITIGAQNASRAFGQLLRGDIVGAARSATYAWSNFRTSLFTNPYLRIIGFTATMAVAVAKWFDHLNSKTTELKKNLEGIRDFRMAQQERISEIKGTDYHSRSMAAIETEEDPARLRGMLEAAKAEAAAREKTANSNTNSYDDQKRKAALFVAGDNALVNWALPKNAERGAKGKKMDAAAERFKEQTLDPSVESLSKSIERVRAIEAKLNQLKSGTGGRGGDSPSSPSSGLSPDEQTDTLRYELSKDRYRARIKDPLKLMLADRAALSARRDSADMNTAEGRAEEVRLAREIFEIEQKITAERERRAQDESAARKDLEARKEEYELSKKSTAEQLKAVEAKMAALRKGPKNTATEGQMLDLKIRRDSLAERLAREAQNSDPDGASSSDAGDDDPGRRVVDGADYSMKEFNPRKRRFRSLGRQGFMGNGLGRSSAWFAATNNNRFSAAGHVGATTEMGQPPLDVKGVDQINRHLAEIKERL